jgi:hypothetical protein
MEATPKKKTHDSMPGVCKKAHERLLESKAKDYVVLRDKNLIICPECKALCLEKTKQSSSPV